MKVAVANCASEITLVANLRSENMYWNVGVKVKGSRKTYSNKPKEVNERRRRAELVKCQICRLCQFVNVEPITIIIFWLKCYNLAKKTKKIDMIKAILVFNNHGKPRLSKFYQYFPEDMQQQIIKETFQLVSKRDDNVCNFLEGGSLIGGSDYKLIYRHYATLYFVFCVDSSESELGILDLIQVFVETLDKCFENVCELDLIFHVDKVHYILNELVMGGMVLETNMTEILTRIEDQNKMEKQEAGISAAPARAVSAVKNLNFPQQIKDIKLPDIPQAIKDLKF